MSIYGAMFAGVSGLAAQSSKIGAISDNIANANTVGYKRTDVPFSTLVTTQGLANSYSAGGVRANPQMQISQQGLLSATNSTTDLAIVGDGMFVVNTAPEEDVGNLSRTTLFTRAGSFLPDSNGYLRNTSGYYLQGWPVDSGGEFISGEPSRTSFASLETINVTGLNFSGSPTTGITFSGNLPADETGGTIDGTPIVTGVEYFDPVGNPQTINLQWTPTTTYGAWTLDLVPSGTTAPIASYDISFATSGTNSGAPTLIQRVPSTVLSAQPTVDTNNDNFFTGDQIRINLNGSVGQLVDGDTIAISVGGHSFNYTINETTDLISDAVLTSNIADAINAQAAAITGISSTSAVANGTQIILTGNDSQSGADLFDQGATLVTDTAYSQTRITETLTLADVTSGDSINFSVDGTDVAVSFTSTPASNQDVIDAITTAATAAGEPVTVTYVGTAR